MTKLLSRRALTSARGPTLAPAHRCNKSTTDQNIDQASSIVLQDRCVNQTSCAGAHQGQLPDDAEPYTMKQEACRVIRLPTPAPLRCSLSQWDQASNEVSESTHTAREGQQSKRTPNRKSKVTGPGKVKKEKWASRNTGQGIARLTPSVNVRSKEKHTFMEGESDDNLSDDSGENNAASRTQKRILACPFYKHDSVRYLSCVRLRLTRVRDVKQHLKRRHRQPLHCPRCGRVFGETQECFAHLMTRTCVQPLGGFVIEGLTPEQNDELRHRVNRSHSEASQWYSIWLVLFPNSPRPTSPYLRNNIEETLGMIQDYWGSHGHELVRELIKSEFSECEQPGLVTTVSTLAVKILLNRFQSSSQLAMYPASANPTKIETVSRSNTNEQDICATASSACYRTTTPPEQRLSEQSQLSQDQEPGIAMGRYPSSSYSAGSGGSISPLALSQSQNQLNPTVFGDALNQGLATFSTNASDEAAYGQLQVSEEAFTDSCFQNGFHDVLYYPSSLEESWLPLGQSNSVGPTLGIGTWCDKGVDLGLNGDISMEDPNSDQYVRNAAEYDFEEAGMLVESPEFSYHIV
ncbi:hypothetical protein HJFPF1_05704 [Paramyrothecium foliicola]|nr:hypothetical protein HJFPF1_05704 [Paramyrothecium foliicola]